jgi:hydroxymethylpyrimidine pyrophosphatase-like HAD family hydrolase
MLLKINKIFFEKIRLLIKAFVFDFDDTIKSNSEPDCKPLELIEKIISNNKFVGIITASGVSVLSTLSKQIIELIKKKNFSTSIYLGIANGMALYKLDKDGKHELYNYPINTRDVQKILESWKSVMNKIGIKENDLMEKGLNTFKDFLNKDWGEFIPKDFLSLSKQFNGKCFVEKLKITFVMPKNGVFLQQDFISLIQMEINKKFGDDRFVIEMGNNIFAHLTRKPGMAPKLFALKRIMVDLDLKNDQVMVFGDMPFGNDKGLLIDSELPYTFTNKFIDEKENPKDPPFVLPECELSPVASVYKAVENLLY